MCAIVLCAGAHAHTSICVCPLCDALPMCVACVWCHTGGCDLLCYLVFLYRTQVIRAPSPASAATAAASSASAAAAATSAAFSATVSAADADAAAVGGACQVPSHNLRCVCSCV